MHLNDASVAIRPRSAWEALDIGTLLARRHAGLLMLTWALLTLPIFALLSLIFWQHPSVSILLFWWLKPLYERLPLFILSRALFGDTPSLSECFRALPGLLRPQWLTSLTWRRLSLTRSFDLPVLQLEQLAGPARRQRLIVLGQRDTGTATWLTIVGMHLELALWLGALALLYLLIPAQLLSDWRWQDLLHVNDDLLWLEHLSNLLYVLVLMIWEPIYVASGFSLYLNRRTHLEAWDLELSFRRLRDRLKTLLPIILLGLGLVFVTPTATVWADAPPVSTVSEPSPDSERLLNQPLSSQAASAAIAELLDKPPFRNSETVTRWRFGEEQTNKEPGWLARLLENVSGFDSFRRVLDNLASALEILLWSSLFGLIGLALWRYREWIRLHAGRWRNVQTTRQAAPDLLFGLEVAPESLPADVIGEVMQLWNEQPRAALGLLYRAFLSRLLHEYRLPLTGAHTEGEVLQLVRATAQTELTHYAEYLTEHWLNLAYGHRLPPDAARDELCNRWRTLFEPQVSA